MALLKIILTAALAAFSAVVFGQGGTAPAPFAKKSLDAAMAGRGVVRDLLKDSALKALARLHQAADPADPRTEKPLLDELAKVKRAQDVFIAWRGRPEKAKAESEQDSAAFERKWQSLGQVLDEAKLKQLRADAGIDAPSDGDQWYNDFLNYLACKANPAACASSR